MSDYERWTIDEAADYLRGVEDAEVVSVYGGSMEDIAVKWHGNNRREVFSKLLRNGWAVTSTSDGYLWFDADWSQ